MVSENATGLVASDTTPLDATIDMAAHCRSALSFFSQQRRGIDSQHPARGTSPLGGQERIVVYTTLVGDGGLFYYLTLAHDQDADALQDAFKRIGESIRLTDGR